MKAYLTIAIALTLSWQTAVFSTTHGCNVLDQILILKFAFYCKVIPNGNGIHWVINKYST